MALSRNAIAAIVDLACRLGFVPQPNLINYEFIWLVLGYTLFNPNYILGFKLT
jgi:hypothetical protein